MYFIVFCFILLFVCQLCFNLCSYLVSCLLRILSWVDYFCFFSWVVYYDVLFVFLCELFASFLSFCFFLHAFTAIFVFLCVVGATFFCCVELLTALVFSSWVVNCDFELMFYSLYFLFSCVVRALFTTVSTVFFVVVLCALFTACFVFFFVSCSLHFISLSLLSICLGEWFTVVLFVSLVRCLLFLWAVCYVCFVLFFGVVYYDLFCCFRRVLFTTCFLCFVLIVLFSDFFVFVVHFMNLSCLLRLFFVFVRF